MSRLEPASLLHIGGTLLAAFLLAAQPATPTSPPKLTPLCSFSGAPDGGIPESAVVIGSGGVLYGSTS